MECVIEYVGSRFLPGDLVLDWGSGCGHQGAWFKAYFGVDLFGVDIAEKAVRWAQKNSIGKYCLVKPEIGIGFVPDQYFDGVFSYATLYHLSHVQQCETVKSFVRVTRAGGYIYVGFNGKHIPELRSPDPKGPFWHRCLHTQPRVGKLSLVLEKKAVIGDWGTGALHDSLPSELAEGIPNYAVVIEVSAVH